MKKKPKRRVKPARKAAKKQKSRKPAKSRVVSKKSAKTKKPKKAKRQKKPQQAAKPGVIAPPNSKALGLVEDYFAKIGVIALTLQVGITLGSKIQVLGHTTRIEQTVDSMQIDHLPVSQAAKGAAVGIKIIDRARRGDHVYLIP